MAPAENGGLTRATSTLRQACERAAQSPHRAPIACDTWVAAGDSEALARLERTLRADGDLNPSWCFLEHLLRENPVPVLEALVKLCGVDPWRRAVEVVLKAELPAQQIDRNAKAVDDLVTRDALGDTSEG